MKTLAEKIEVMHAADTGAQIQWARATGSDNTWHDCEVNGKDILWDWVTFDFRRKPTPKRVPLGPEDVPPGSIVGSTAPNTAVKWWSVWAVASEGMYFGCRSDINLHKWEYLMDSSFQLSTDNGKTWRPCFKIEEGA